MAAEIKEENLSLALRFIVEKFGKDALLNQNKVNLYYRIYYLISLQLKQVG